MYACPEGLDPKGATVIEKKLAKAQQLKWSGGDISVHPMFDYRKVPTKKLMQRLDVLKFRNEGPLMDFSFNPAIVRIPLNQHVGAPAEPVIKIGDTVSKYELIGESSGKISSNVHSSIDGKVASINKNEIIIQRN